jgi:hypothetical protein
MPSRCCVPGCNSNYDSVLKTTEDNRGMNIFKFPKNERSYKLFRPFGASFSNNSLVLSYFLDSRNSLITHKLNMGAEVCDFFQALTPQPHPGIFPKSILHLSVTDHSMVSIFRHRDE